MISENEIISLWVRLSKVRLNSLIDPLPEDEVYSGSSSSFAHSGFCSSWSREISWSGVGKLESSIDVRCKGVTSIASSSSSKEGPFESTNRASEDSLIYSSFAGSFSPLFWRLGSNISFLGRGPHGTGATSKGIRESDSVLFASTSWVELGGL